MERIGWIKGSLMQQYELNVGDIKKVKKKFNVETKKLWHKNNREKILEGKKLYYKNNREKILELKKLYYKNNKEKIIETKKLYRKNNKEKIAKTKKLYYENATNVSSYDDINITYARVKLHKIKGSVARRNHLNISVTLTAEDIIGLIPKDLKCPVYKKLFIFKGQSEWNLSFDRIDNNKGYHKDNVVVVSSRANAIKSAATLKELYQVADFYYELEKKMLDK